MIIKIRIIIKNNNNRNKQKIKIIGIIKKEVMIINQNF